MLTHVLIEEAITTTATITQLTVTTTMRLTVTTTLVSVSALILFEIIYFMKFEKQDKSVVKKLSKSKYIKNNIN